MPIIVKLPAALRTYTGHKGDMHLEAATVGDIINHLAETWPDLKPHLLDEDGSLRSFVSVFVDGRSIKSTGGLATVISDGQTVTLVPAIAGGGTNS
ncbi:MAG: MoaD/ThiS family protein [Deltaproteobacteria bacterium]|jgi:MoaD family protein|nr:MoaD/ThiS family protein [Deltaproteobacteria bacterium]